MGTKTSGKRDHQKLKPYLVLDYLQHNSDENHAVSAAQIVGYLQEAGIDAERRSIYRDIDEINKALLMVDQDMYLDEAEEELEKYGDDVRHVVYDASKKGFYVRERRYEFDEIRLAAESIYASKFLTERESETFVDLLCGFVSDYQAEQIKHDVLLTDRVKTDNKYTFRNVATINAAMSKELDGQKHIPEKITFKYMKYSISDLKQQVEKKQGARYKVSPYALLLTDGNYYLMAFDDESHKMKTYRVDRMRDVQYTDEPREGSKEFAAIDFKSYTKRVFGMFEGERRHITILCANNLLDTMIDRFGTKAAHYSKKDEEHFVIMTEVDLSDQFFSWVCGFGDRVKILDSDIAAQFTAYLDRIRKQY